MWKVFAGFIAFALLALFVIMKGGENVDMMGEAGHGVTSSSDSASTPDKSAPVTPAEPSSSKPATSN